MNRRNLNNANTYMSTSVGGRRSPWYPAESEDTARDGSVPDASKERDTQPPTTGDDEEPSQSAQRRYRPEGPLLL